MGIPPKSGYPLLDSLSWFDRFYHGIPLKRTLLAGIYILFSVKKDEILSPLWRRSGEIFIRWNCSQHLYLVEELWKCQTEGCRFERQSWELVWNHSRFQRHDINRNKDEVDASILEKLKIILQVRAFHHF